MSRNAGTFGLSSNIEPLVAAPLDARMKVTTLEDLTASASFPYHYVGMLCYVVSEQKLYALRYDDPTILENWEPVGTGKDGKDGRDVVVDSTSKVGRENIVTLVWHDPNGSDKYIDLTILDGARGEVGPQGPEGPQGRSFSIQSQFGSEEDLRTAHPTGEEGEAYLVGNDTDTPDLWYWDVEESDWVSYGPLKGAQGPKGDPGESPEVTVVENGDDVYKLKIKTKTSEYTTPNLKGKDGDKSPDDHMDSESRNSVENGVLVTEFAKKQDKTLSSSIEIGSTTATTVEEALSALNDKTVDVDTSLDGSSNNPIANSTVTNGLNSKQPKTLSSSMTVGETEVTTVEGALTALNNKTVDVDATIDSGSNNPISNSAVSDALGNKVDKSSLGAANGVAELDSNGYVPSSQLPSYVDDIVECYYDAETEKIYKDSEFTKEITPEDGKIYVDKDTNALWRWTGSILVSPGSANALSLGETAQTAYRGDRGKIAYDDSQTNKSNIGNLENLETTAKSNLVSAINEVKSNAATNASAIEEKVNKVEGKQLSTNDYDNVEKAEVAKVKDKQDKVLSVGITVNGVVKSTVENTLEALANLANFNAGTKLDELAIADEFNENVDYAVDQYVIYDNRLYKTKIAHTAGEWNSEHFEEKQVMSEIIAAAVSDYDSLQNRPQLAGIVWSGNKTYSEMGIQQAEEGKGLSTNDYDDTAKAIVDGISNALDNKVDKVEGKGLSTNDYDNTEKGKVTNATTHISQTVTDENGVHGFKVVSVNEGKDSLFYKNGANWKEIELGSIIQVETMPTPAAKYVGKIYQYVGTSSDDYKKGYFYECVNNSGTYTWQPVRVQSGGGQTIQYDTLPQAEASKEGAIVQYTGEDTEDYTKGHFYECTEGDEAGTYGWKEKSVDTVTLSDEDIADIKKAFDNAVNPPIITTWVNGTQLPFDFGTFVACIYNGKINILGGYNKNNNSKYHYQLDNNVWKSVSTLPEAIQPISNYDFVGQAVVYNNKIMIFNSGYLMTWDGTSWTKSSWTVGSDFPYHNFVGGAAVVYDNKVHIIGGTNDNKNKHYTWNGETWTTETLPFSECIKPTYVVYKNKIHIIYVDTTSGRGVKRHFTYNGTEWDEVSDIWPEGFAPDYATYAVVYNDKINIIGNYRYEYNDGEWVRKEEIGTDQGTRVVVLNNQIHIIGGIQTKTVRRHLISQMS